MGRKGLLLAVSLFDVFGRVILARRTRMMMKAREHEKEKLMAHCVCNES